MVEEQRCGCASGFGNRVGMRKKYCEAKKDAKRVVEKVDSCHDGRECLELPNKGLGRREMLLGLVVLKMKVGR